MEMDINKMTEEDVKAVNNILDKAVENSEELRMIKELPSNNGVEDATEKEDGYFVDAEVVTNPETGEKSIINTLGEHKEDKSIEEKVADLSYCMPKDDYMNTEITKDEMTEATSGESLIGELDLNDNEILDILKVTNKLKNREKIGYKDLPDKVKNVIDDFIKRNMPVDAAVVKTAQLNTMRNSIANALLEEYIGNIEFKRMTDDFNFQIEKLYDTTAKEISPLIKDYNANREKEILKLTEGIEDEEKKEKITKILDAINDGFTLVKFKEKAPSIKIKNYDYEKPSRTYSSFLAKYSSNPSKHIYNPELVAGLLDKHLKSNKFIDESDKRSALKFTLGFCKFCINMNPNNAEEHAFMYYTTYNVVLLDLYKDEQYAEYAPAFLKNVMEVIEKIR